MKSLGTVTVYLPFVDSITKQMVMDTMQNALHYRDFSRRMGNLCSSTEVPDLFVFTTVHHATSLYDYDALDKVAREYGDLSIIQPNLYFAGSYLSGKVQWDKARAAAEKIFLSTDIPWIKLEMLLNQLKFEVFDFTGSLKTHDVIELIGALMNEHAELSSLEYRLYDSLSHLSRIEGNLEEAIRCADKALVLARKIGDDFSEGHLLRTKAFLIQRSDHILARDYLNIAKGILTPLGDDVGITNILHQLGLVDAIRGEYDSAIEFSLQAIKNGEILGMPIGILSSNLSTLYNAAGDHESGNTWAELAEVELADQNSHLPRAKLSKAWSLVHQGKLDTATSVVDETKDTILKSGIEHHLAQMYFVEGLIEFADADCSAAISSFEKAYDINRRLGRVIMDTVCLHNLAKAEIYALDVDDSNRDAEFSGHWLRLFEEHSESKDMPGINGQAQLLKAQLRIKQVRYEEARRLLKQVDTLSAQRGMAFLKGESSKILEALDH